MRSVGSYRRLPHLWRGPNGYLYVVQPDRGRWPRKSPKTKKAAAAEAALRKLMEGGGASGRPERRITLVQAAREWLEQFGAAVEPLRRDRGTLPKSRLGEAVTYLVNLGEAQSAFLGDARLPIHNNDTERDLRHLALGRNNWMIFGSPRGGEVACRLYSLVLSCKESGVDPQAYLEDVLRRIGSTPIQDLATLTPWGWKAARAQAEIQN